MSTTTKEVQVTLKSVPGSKDGKPKSRKFPISQANKLLKIKKSAWVLDDKGFEFNGIELAKAK